MDVRAIPSLCWDLIISYIQYDYDVVKLLSCDPDFFLQNIQLSKVNVTSNTVWKAIENLDFPALAIVDQLLIADPSRTGKCLHLIEYLCSGSAAKHNTPELLEWLKKHNVLDIQIAASVSNPTTLAWLQDQFPDEQVVLNLGAWGLARGGYVEELKHLVSKNNIPCYTSESAAKYVKVWNFQLVENACWSLSTSMLNFVKEKYGFRYKDWEIMVENGATDQFITDECAIPTVDWIHDNVILPNMKSAFYEHIFAIGFRAENCALVDWARNKCPSLAITVVDEDTRAHSFANSYEFFCQMDVRFNLKLDDVEDLFIGNNVIYDNHDDLDEDQLLLLYRSCLKKFGTQIPGKWWRELFVDAVRFNFLQLAKWIYQDVCCPNFDTCFHCLLRPLRSDTLQWFIPLFQLERADIVRRLDHINVTNLTYLHSYYHFTSQEIITAFTRLLIPRYGSLLSIKNYYQSLMRRCDLEHIQLEYNKPNPETYQWFISVKTGGKRPLDDDVN